MATPAIPDHTRKQRKFAVDKFLAEGYAPKSQGGAKGSKGSAVEAAARYLGECGPTLRSWMKAEDLKRRRGEEHFCPDFSLFIPAKMTVRVQADSESSSSEIVADPEQKPRVRLRVERDDFQDYYVIAIGDAHDAPDIPKDRFRWAGQFCAEMKPDVIIQIGDFFTLDSISQFAQPGSIEFKELPTFPDDITSAEGALNSFDEGMGAFSCDKHVTCGNHEDRLLSFEGRTPQVGDMLSLEFDRLLGRHGWSYSPFAKPMWWGGVAFSHIGLTIMGRPMGGELTSANMALRSIDDWVVGHTHRAEVSRRPKLGGKHVTCINLGSYLPTDHVEHYIKHGTLLGWSYSLFELRISKGKIQSYRQHTVDELAERYG